MGLFSGLKKVGKGLAGGVLSTSKAVTDAVLPNLGAVGGFTNGIINGDGLSGALKQGLNSGKNALVQGAAIFGGPIASSATGAGALGGTGGGFSSFLPSIANSGISAFTNDKTKDALLKQQQRSIDQLSPFLQSQFNPSDLENDPGYQFQLQQGQKSADQAAAARGNYFSGEALKEAQNYGQGLANTTYNDAYRRFLEDRQQKLGVAGALTNVYDNIGNVRANAITNTGNSVAAGAAGVLGGNGFNNAGQSFNQYAVLGGNNINSLLSGLTPEQRAQLKASL